MKRLRVGDRFRHDGDIYVVERVTESAAHARQEYSEPKLVTLPNGKTFWSRRGGRTLAVSAHAMIDKVGETNAEDS